MFCFLHIYVLSRIVVGKHSYVYEPNSRQFMFVKHRGLSGLHWSLQLVILINRKLINHKMALACKLAFVYKVSEKTFNSYNRYSYM